MKIKIVFIALVILLSIAVTMMLCWATESSQPSPDVDVEIVKEGCRLAASSIGSEQGKMASLVTARTNDGGTQTVKTEYEISRRGQRFLLSSVSTVLDVRIPPGAESKLYVKPGEVIRKQLSFDGQMTTAAMPDMNVARVSAYDSSSGQAVLLEYEDEVGLPHYGRVDIGNIDKHIRHGKDYIGSGPKVIGREWINGSECIIVEMVWTNSSRPNAIITETWRFWIDPARGYTVPKIRKWKQGGIYSEKTLVAEIDTELRQYGDIWAPCKVVHNSYRIDRETGQPYRRQSKTITYSADFLVNAPVTDAELKLTLPSGTKVYDEIHDAKYTIP